MREIVGWTCAIILGITLAGGLIAGAIEAVRNDDPIGVVAVALMVMLALIAGAAWGLG